MARPATKFVTPLTEEERDFLRFLRDHGETARIRKRAHAILLSDAGKSINELTEIFETTYITVLAWIGRWEDHGFQGLADAPRPGAPPKLTESEQQLVVELLQKNPHSPKRVVTEITALTGKTIGRTTIREIARKSQLRWKRARKSMKDRRDLRHSSRQNRT